MLLICFFFGILISRRIIIYKPPFAITNYMLSRTISITEKLGQISTFDSLNRMPVLRRNNKIKSIHSSLVIEANSLSLNQVRDVIACKTVIRPFGKTLVI